MERKFIAQRIESWSGGYARELALPALVIRTVEGDVYVFSLSRETAMEMGQWLVGLAQQATPPGHQH